ncbi:MAG: YceI family protein [Vicinamibacterales bacterium]
MSRRAGLVSTLVIAIGVSATAQQQNVDFSVSGTSTIRGWTCTVKGVMAVTPGSGPAQPAAPGFANGVQAATVTVQVKAFTCPNDEMREHLLQAMKADKFSEIVFRLDKYDVKGAQALATGTLTITGVTQPISLPIALNTADQGLQIEGNTRLDMTKYGVDPPVVMAGLLKVGPQIRIEFKGIVAR